MTLSCILLALLAGAPSIPVAASGERLWVMEPSTDLKGHFDLAVQGPPGEPGTLTVVRRLAALPGSITGLEDTLWVDLLRTGDMPITDVLQVTARWSDATMVSKFAMCGPWTIAQSSRTASIAL